MKNECKFFDTTNCLCSVCQSMREVIEQAEETPKEEIENAFAEAEKILHEFDSKERMIKNEQIN